MPQQVVSSWWFLLSAIAGAAAAAAFGLFRDKFLTRRERQVVFLETIVGELKELEAECLHYWSRAATEATGADLGMKAVAIKTRLKRIASALDIANQELKLKYAVGAKRSLDQLFDQATGGSFESEAREADIERGAKAAGHCSWLIVHLRVEALH